MSIIGLALLLIISVVLIKIEYRYYKVFYTPFILLTVPYCFIIVFQNFINVLYGFEACTFEYYIYLIIHFVLVWLADYIVFKLFISKKTILTLSDKNDLNTWNKFEKDRTAAKIVKFVSLFSSIFMLVEFVILAKGVQELGNIVQTEFQTRYGGGLGFYLRLLSMIGCVYFFSICDKKHKRNLLYGFICLLPNILTFVKGIIFLNIIAGFLGNLIIHKRKINFKILFSVVILGIIIFFGVYLIEYCVWDITQLFNKERYEYIFAKLISYLISGVGGFNSWLIAGFDSTPAAINPVYAPFINFLAKFGLTTNVDTISNEWIYIGYIPNYGDFSTNTMSYIGALVLHCGLLVSIIVGFVFALMQSLLFAICIKKRSVVPVLTYALMASMFVLGWFDYYFYQTFWVYLIALLLLIAVISNIAKECKVKRVIYDRS